MPDQSVWCLRSAYWLLRTQLRHASGSHSLCLRQLLCTQSASDCPHLRGARSAADPRPAVPHNASIHVVHVTDPSMLRSDTPPSYDYQPDAIEAFFTNHCTARVRQHS